MNDINHNTGRANKDKNNGRTCDRVFVVKIEAAQDGVIAGNRLPLMGPSFITNISGMRDEPFTLTLKVLPYKVNSLKA